MQRSLLRRKAMRSAPIVVSAGLGLSILGICVSAAGTFLWAKSEPAWEATPAAALSMPSIERLHAKAKGLPEKTVKELY
jgi:hypothetical protein